MRMLDGAAELDQQVQLLPYRELIGVAVIRDLDAAHEFHHKIGSALVRGAGVKNLGDIGMVDERQRLALGLEAGHHPPGIHAELDALERDLGAPRLPLLGPIAPPAAAVAELPKQPVTADSVAGFL